MISGVIITISVILAVLLDSLVLVLRMRNATSAKSCA